MFAAEHGSWNRATRTGYKIIRAIVKDGVPTGEYEDFVTGFVIDDSSVWGRPVGVAQAQGRRAPVLRGRQRHDLAGQPREPRFGQLMREIAAG